jgi:putative hydrolase of the HAD superfamily
LGNIMIKAIIFDVGGVITKDFPGFKILAEKLGIDYNLIVRVWKENETEIHKHKMTTEDFLNIVKEKTKLNADIVGTWEKIYSENLELDQDVLKIIENLKGKYKLAIISNVSELHARLKRGMEFYSHFDAAILSHEVGAIKPQKEIFAHALKKLNLRAYECIFIDDKAENIAAAKALGFTAINFKNAEQLASELKALGVDI